MPSHGPPQHPECERDLAPSDPRFPPKRPDHGQHTEDERQVQKQPAHDDQSRRAVLVVRQERHELLAARNDAHEGLEHVRPQAHLVKVPARPAERARAPTPNSARPGPCRRSARGARGARGVSAPRVIWVRFEGLDALRQRREVGLHALDGALERDAGGGADGEAVLPRRKGRGGSAVCRGLVRVRVVGVLLWRCEFARILVAVGSRGLWTV